MTFRLPTLDPSSLTRWLPDVAEVGSSLTQLITAKTEPRRRTSLPQDDEHPKLRLAALEQARGTYEYCYEYPPGIAVALRVPPAEQFSLRYKAAGGLLLASAVANRAGQAIAAPRPERAHRVLDEILKDLDGLVRAPSPLSAGAPQMGHAPRRARAKSIREYYEMLNVYRVPESCKYWPASGTDSDDPKELTSDVADRAFAWQRIAGANPLQLQKYVPPSHQFAFASNLKRLQAISEPHGVDDLKKAAALGRVFVADYVALERLGLTTPPSKPHRLDGIDRYLFAPIALFYLDREERLRPLAIQWDQQGSRVVTPDEGWGWLMARSAVQVADGNVHEAIWHLGHCHFVIEAVSMAAARQLAPNHPLSVLLEPHLQWTIALNDYAIRTLLAPNGGLESVLAAPVSENLRAVREDLQQSYRFLTDASFERSITSRGLDIASIAEYPYRDDGSLVHEAIRYLVSDYVEFYYNDENVRTDHELQAFIDEAFIRDDESLRTVENKGRIHLGAKGVDDVKSLCTFLENVIWTASAQHACLNFAQFPYMGFVPNIFGASYCDVPAPGSPPTRDQYMDMLPPIDTSETHVRIAYALSHLHENTLGDYPEGHFSDPRVDPIIKRFRNDLADADRAISAKDATRFLSYPFLRPPFITASIHV